MLGLTHLSNSYRLTNSNIYAKINLPECILILLFIVKNRKITASQIKS
jgi:hypothetical protein